jgi:hypothetical protein
MIELTPSGEHPLPFDLSDQQPKTHKDSIAIAANTADLLEELGGPIEYSDADLHAAAELINGTDKPNAPRHITLSSEAKAASVLIKKFDFHAFTNVQQARNYITNKLIQISDCGDPKIELRALELLGKHSDIGLFTERSEITVHHKNSSDLENSIRERIKILLHSDVTDVEPLINELETKPVQKTEEIEQVEDDVHKNEGESGHVEGENERS